MPFSISSRLLWSLLVAPSVALTLAATRAGADLDALTARSGDCAAVLLGAALAISPVARLVGGPGALRLRHHRRAVGLAAFAASLIHLVIYALAMGELAAIRAEWLAPGIWPGWFALLLMLPLALTSTDAAMRRLGRRWKRLHRLIWPAAALVLVHWAVVHDGRTTALVAGAALAAIELTRLFPLPRTRKAA